MASGGCPTTKKAKLEQGQQTLAFCWSKSQNGRSAPGDDVSASPTVVEVDEEDQRSPSTLAVEEPKTLTPRPELDSDSIDKDEVEDHSSLKPPDGWTTQELVARLKSMAWLACRDGRLFCKVCSSFKSLSVEKSQGLRISSEWVETGVTASLTSTTKSNKMRSFRTKLSGHVASTAHVKCSQMQKTAKTDQIRSSFAAIASKNTVTTEHIFRTAYFIAKHNRPYTDHEKLVELQDANGLHLGCTLHSRASATAITDLISSEMRKKLCQSIIDSQCKISIMLDESTTVSNKSSLMLYMRTSLYRVNGTIGAFSFPLELCELEGLSSEIITTAMLKILSANGFDSDYLSSHLIGACSDGASNMLGRKTGVLTRLKEKCPNILLWHCLCHRLELAVGDAVKAVGSVNHIKSFLDKLYSVYSQSPNMQRELEKVAQQLNCQLKKIGRVLDVRWAASSKLTLEAIWLSYPALCAHFEACSSDAAKKSYRSFYNGLLATLTSVQFVHSLATLLDALSEVATMSETLQAELTSMAYAYMTLKQTITALQQQKEGVAGDAFAFFQERQVDLEMFKGVTLHNLPNKPQLNREQFLQALLDSMESRLNCSIASNKSSTSSDAQDELVDILQEINILDKTKWPSYVTSPWVAGKTKLKSLCARLNVVYGNFKKPFRDFLSQPDNEEPKEISDLKEIVASYPVVSADCERGFSAMNLICSDIRNALTINHISNLLFISLAGPPVSVFKPGFYVKEWFKKHRHANDTRSKQTALKDSDRYKKIWPLLE